MQIAQHPRHGRQDPKQTALAAYVAYGRGSIGRGHPPRDPGGRHHRVALAFGQSDLTRGWPRVPDGRHRQDVRRGPRKEMSYVVMVRSCSCGVRIGIGYGEIGRTPNDTIPPPLAHANHVG